MTLRLMTVNEFYPTLDVSIEVSPQSKTGGKRLTEEEDNEYHQIQGKKLNIVIKFYRRGNSFVILIYATELLSVIKRKHTKKKKD